MQPVFKTCNVRKLIFIYLYAGDYGIKLTALLCARYRPYVLSQHLLKGLLF